MCVGPMHLRDTGALGRAHLPPEDSLREGNARVRPVLVTRTMSFCASALVSGPETPCAIQLSAQAGPAAWFPSALKPRSPVGKPLFRPRPTALFTTHNHTFRQPATLPAAEGHPSQRSRNQHASTPPPSHDACPLARPATAQLYMEYLSSAKMRPVVQYYLRKHKEEARPPLCRSPRRSLGANGVEARFVSPLSTLPRVPHDRSRTGPRSTASATSQVRHPDSFGGCAWTEPR